MKLFKSKAGFTLIELLVVIGILAVLAAIAIPSVAGLIDRANVSADKTNANEMTNAIERFTSEYELYCQDIASGAVQAGNLDSAQGRVYNVLGGATTRAEITALEKPATAGPETTGRAIYRDTKYPVNAETMQAIVENYTKTSSSTFEPKQSDMHYWYSPDCGVVVYAVPEASVTDLNKQVISNMDAKGNELSASTRWIDLTLGTSLSANITVDWTNIDKTTLENNSWEDIHSVIASGKISETEWKVGDKSPVVTFNGVAKQTILIGINHDGANTATFIAEGSFGVYPMNANNSNVGGWKNSDMRTYLNGELYNGMVEVKDYIKAVEKKTNNVGSNPTQVTTTLDNVFLLSVNEMNELDGAAVNNSAKEKSILEQEGAPYEYFVNGGTVGSNFFYFHWLRSPFMNSDDQFYFYFGGAVYNYADEEYHSHPCFVIG